MTARGELPTGALRLVSTRPLGALLFAAALSGASLPGVALGAASAPAPQGPGGGPQAGDVVARLEMAAPPHNHFLLRATLPVPERVLMGQDTVPLTVLNRDGSPAPTQVECVSSYPDLGDGAAVVQVLAHVERHVFASSGDWITYDVIWDPHVPGSFDEDPSSRSLLFDPHQVELVTHDLFGNEYRGDLFRDLRVGAAVRQREGELLREWRTHSILKPVPAQGGPLGTMPRMMGVHAYVTQTAGEPFLILTLRVHNGLDGFLTDVEEDDALNELYFAGLELELPEGWRVLHAYDDPFIGDDTVAGGRVTHPIVAPNGDGTMHLMRRQGQMCRRLAIAPADDIGVARSTLAKKLLAYCLPGPTAAGGRLWSWWNRETSNYQVQNIRLPLMDHLDLDAMREGFQDEYNIAKNHLKNGTANSQGLYPFIKPAMGYRHAWGTPYGGMAGGVEVDIQSGVEVAASASRYGYRLVEIMGRMYMDRHPVALYDLHGEPSDLEKWLIDGPNGPYWPGFFDLRPILPAHDPFDFGGAPDFQTLAVERGNLQPSYQDQLNLFQPIDLQHIVRYYANFKTLAWLGNDAFAKDELHMTAQLFRLSYHEYYVSPNNHLPGFNLLNHELFVADHPGEGFGFGRASGWLLDSVVCSYALSGQQKRAALRPYLRRIVDVAELAQSTCGGYIQAQPHHGLGSRFRIRQSFEAGIAHNGLRALLGSVFRGTDPGRTAAITRMIVAEAYGSISPAFWSDSHNAPYSTVAVGPYDVELPPYCADAEDNYASSTADFKYQWNSLAFAYEHTRDDVFLERALDMSLDDDLLDFAMEAGDVNNRAGFVSFVQLLNDIY